MIIIDSTIPIFSYVDSDEKKENGDDEGTDGFSSDGWPNNEFIEVKILEKSVCAPDIIPDIFYHPTYIFFKAYI